MIIRVAFFVYVFLLSSRNSPLKYSWRKEEKAGEEEMMLERDGASIPGDGDALCDALNCALPAILPLLVCFDSYTIGTYVQRNCTAMPFVRVVITPRWCRRAGDEPMVVNVGRATNTTREEDEEEGQEWEKPTSKKWGRERKRDKGRRVYLGTAAADIMIICERGCTPDKPRARLLSLLFFSFFSLRFASLDVTFSLARRCKAIAQSFPYQFCPEVRPKGPTPSILSHTYAVYIGSFSTCGVLYILADHAIAYSTIQRHAIFLSHSLEIDIRRDAQWFY